MGMAWAIPILLLDECDATLAGDHFMVSGLVASR
jgi:hypothetical protein